MTMILKTILLMPCAYLLGSVPWGVIMARLFAGVNIQKAGSGNIGAYNVFRVAGKTPAVITLVGDVSKGALPVLLAMCWLEAQGWKGELLVCLVAFSAFLGHLFPVFLRFRGGKGVATASGCFLVISPAVFAVCVLVYVLVLSGSGYSSAGSLSAAAATPLVTWLTTHSVPITAYAVATALLIFVRHSANIKRLLEGTEHSSLRG